MAKTTTEKYIEKAVQEAKNELSATNISHCNFTVDAQAEGATQALANALLAQAEANEANSIAIQSLTEKLKATNVYAIKVGNHCKD